jgi:hypothetical protein
MIWLLGIPFIGPLINILTPAVKGIVEGVVDWIKACWHGVKTSNYGTWTLILTACVLTWTFTTCPTKVCPKEKASISKTSKGESAKDIFLDWFK